MVKKQESISIEDILGKDNYIIPIYQRNYEWKKEQIAKLINDIDGISADEKYYLGTLVTIKRNDGSYELIDGQQRHTTLNLIKGVLKKETQFNLKFDARYECQIFLEDLSKKNFDDIKENPKSKNLYDGISIIKDIFNEKGFVENSEKRQSFSDKFFKNTKIFRTELPKGTDLNHYFEIMNNRGEQLENHEILKSNLMGAIDNDTEQLHFSKIWDACSYMGDYIWRNLKDDKLLFENKNIDVEKLESIQIENIDSDNISLENILVNHELKLDFKQEEQETSDKYRSILDFSTFLIYVLYLSENIESDNYDDKKLLNIFEGQKVAINESEKKFSNEFATKFYRNLLKYRFIYDQFIIKQDLSQKEDEQDKEAWGIRTFNNEKESLVTIEGVFGNSDFERKIEMLQTMFHYSTISNNKKEWIFQVLQFVDNRQDYKPEEKDLYDILRNHLVDNLSEKLIEEKYPEIQAKTFYYFEYMLWEYYFDNVRKDNLEKKEDIFHNQISMYKSLFNSFRFKQLNSKEHLLSQDKFRTFESTKGLTIDDLNSFSNLCLISNNENSSAGNYNHFEKKEKYSNSTSLKRLLMFSRFRDKEWDKECMDKHLDDMKFLLQTFKN